jgi:hypothetical protein
MHRIALVLLISMVALPMLAFGQAGKCTLMDLTVQTPITLAELPDLVSESLHLEKARSEVSGPQVVINIWLKVLHNAQQPDERLELYFNGSLLETRAHPQWTVWEGSGWHLWSRPVLVTEPGSLRVEVRSYTRTKSAGNRPSVILIGAAELAGTALTGGPTQADTLAEAEYSTTLSNHALGLTGIYEITAEDVGTVPQNYTARLGGLGAPRLSTSLRFGSDATSEEEGEDGEGESSVVDLDAYVQLMYGDTMINGQMEAHSIPLPFVNGINAFKVAQDCYRVYDYIPEYLYSIPQFPKLRVSIDPNFPEAFLVIDDFTLTYVTPMLEMMDEAWVAADNLIINGGFEKGNYPYIIESPTGAITCPRVADVINRIDDACRGNYAAVFKFHVPDAFVASCDVERLIGKNMGATLVVTGLNLESITAVALIPQSYRDTQWQDDGNYLLLTPGGDAGGFGDMDEVRFPFSFSSPFNTAVNGDLICTDGVATFECLIHGEFKEGLLDNCGTLIDTVEPVLVIDSPVGIVDACSVSPSICNVNRAVPDSKWELPGDWLPGNGTAIPKNSASYLVSDTRVFVNPGSRQDVPFSQANGPGENLTMRVSARFVDVPPSLNGVPFPVTVSGFYDRAGTASTPFEFPGGRRGTARWSGVAAAPTALDSYAQALASDMDMTTTWTVTIARGSSTDLWDYSFKPMASDRAGNISDTSNLNNIWIHWLYRTRARFTDREAVLSEPPVGEWSLDSPTLPDTGTHCRQLARFYLYTLDDNGQLGSGRSTDWMTGPLTAGTLLSNGNTFHNTVRGHYGQALCLAVIGADETGNIQYFPDNLSSRGHLIAAEIDHIVWVPGRDNEAINTQIALKLFSENIEEVKINESYGSSLRVPLPPFSMACQNRINAQVSFSSTLPTSGLSGRQEDPAILWKFYRNGTLVATGLAPDPSSGLNLIEDLLLTTNKAVQVAPDRLTDALDQFDVPSVRRLIPSRFMATAPDICGDGRFNRLGDEGNAPDPQNLNRPSKRRQEVFYTLTAQAIFVDHLGSFIVDPTPASVSFSIYPATLERFGDTPVREFSR